MKKFNLLFAALLCTVVLNAGSLPLLMPQVSNVKLAYNKAFSNSETKTSDMKFNDVIAYPTNVSAQNDPTVSKDAPNEFLVKELNTSGEAQSYPWLSNDGLRVYYTHDKYMYVASRTSINGKFSSGKSVFTNLNETVISGWLTPDELTIYFASQSSKLFKATRTSVNENFTSTIEIKLINQPTGSLFDASFTPDMEELLMYNNDTRERIVKFIKTGNNEYKFEGEVNVLSKETPTGGQLSRDGLRFYVPFKRIANGSDDYRYIYVLTRKAMHDNFSGIEQVKTTKEINITAYQPTINADETQMLFVTGSENLWDNNDLCQVDLIKEIVVVRVPVKDVDPVKITPEKPFTIEYRGDKNNGSIPAIFISDDNKTMIYDYTGNTLIPDGYKVVVNENAVTDKPVETKNNDGSKAIEMKITPNPFIEQTQIEITAPEGGYMVVQVYSMDGQIVSTLFDGQSEKGINIIKWVKKGLSNGVYTVKAIVGNNVTTKKVVTCEGTN